MADPKTRPVPVPVPAPVPVPEKKSGDACDLDGIAPPRNVTMAAKGAKRGSYFRDRDYR